MAAFDSYREHVNPTLARLEAGSGVSREFVRAAGCSLWDREGREYLDFGAGHGSFSLGHYDPDLVAALSAELKSQPLQIHSMGPSQHMGELAEALVSRLGAPYSIAFFTNSGTEAVEGALKLARAATGRRKVVYCRGAYHGTTLGSLSMMAEGPLRDGFEPLLTDFIATPYNDADRLRSLLQARDVAAFVVEPVQCEAGVLLPSGSFLRDAVELCRAAGTLSVFDEIQCGLGRTGRLFAFEHWDCKPDVITTGKAFGGGLMPIGAYVTSRQIQDRAYGTFVNCGIHHSTFGGNSLACRVALAALAKLSDETLLAGVRERGAAFLSTLRLKFAGSRLISDIRGVGFLIGLEFRMQDHPWLLWENMGLPEFSGLNSIPFLVMREMLKEGVVVHVCAHNWSVLKIEPPLVAGDRHIADFISVLEKALGRIEDKAE